jgi:hypothetical protein
MDLFELATKMGWLFITEPVCDLFRACASLYKLLCFGLTQLIQPFLWGRVDAFSKKPLQRSRTDITIRGEKSRAIL